MSTQTTRDLHTAALAAAAEVHGYALDHMIQAEHVIEAYRAQEEASYAEAMPHVRDVRVTQIEAAGFRVIGDLPASPRELDAVRCIAGPVTVYRIDPDTGERVLVGTQEARTVSRRGRIGEGGQRKHLQTVTEAAKVSAVDTLDLLRRATVDAVEQYT